MSFENRRSQRIKSSPSMAVAMAAKQLMAAGHDIVDLSLGEADFEPPQHVKDAACEAVRAGGIRYTQPAGMEALRSAIAEKFRRENGLDFPVDAITIANGAKQILFDAFLATLEPGDEVVIPTPCWVSYGDIVALHGGEPCLIDCGPETGFKLTPERLEAAITSRTRWLMLNSPSNPTGAVYSHDEFRALADVLARHPRVLVMSDEIYEHIVLGSQPFVSFGQSCPELAERTLIVNGVSKAYAMTGWRVGYAVGPKPLIAAINKMQSQSVTSVCTVAQVAALAALTGDQGFVAQAAGVFRERATLVAARIARLRDVVYVPPQGAFYAFIGLRAYIGSRTPSGRTLADDAALADCLLRDFGLSSIPGSAFGAPSFVRLSIAASTHELERAADRLEAMLASLDRATEEVA